MVRIQNHTVGEVRKIEEAARIEKIHEAVKSIVTWKK